MLKAGLALTAAALLASGCSMRSVAAETRHESKSIELEKVDAARVQLRMGAGELRVKGGSPKLMEADFAYNVPDWKPVVDYRSVAGAAELTIAQPKDSGIRIGPTEYTWDVKLNNQVPLDVVAHLGAGEANLVLGQMMLRSIDVSIGAGEVKIDLRGDPKKDYSVNVHGGVGEATIYLPRDVGISATAGGGLGDISTEGLEKRNGVWINPDRPNASVTVHLDAKGGIGQIRLIR